MNAPFCPVSKSQPTSSMSPTLQPSVPLATDLQSLIAAVNAMIDIVRNLTTSLTVNNVWQPRQPLPNKNYWTSAYPEWDQISVGTSSGYVYYKSKGTVDTRQRAFIQRINTIDYNNTNGADNPFLWKYSIPLDSLNTQYNNAQTADEALQDIQQSLQDAQNSAQYALAGMSPFKEDFFERVVNVHWGVSKTSGLAVEFFDGAD